MADTTSVFISYATEDGAPIKVVQERLGHSSPMTMLAVYWPVLPGEHAEYAERMARRVRSS